MRYYLIAGEASGDIHGANLMRALLDLDPKAHFRFWGGDRMAKYGGDPVMHYRDLAYMGFQEVACNLRAILRNIKNCKADILQFNPDALILLDYPGFNIRIAKWARKQGLACRIIYYISPQVWAWKAGRAKVLQEVVDDMYVILPFEVSFYQKYHLDATYVGHPLLDHLNTLEYEQDFRKSHNLDAKKAIIALLPGSRQQEIENILPLMLSVVDDFAEHHFVVAAVSTVDQELYKMARQFDNVSLVVDKTNDLLATAEAALVTSGTATLETALMKVPMVVCYKTSAITYWLAKHFIKIKFISLVNLIMNRMVVRELIQQELNRSELTRALKKILDVKHKARVLADYQELRKTLGEGGASNRTAAAIVSSINP